MTGNRKALLSTAVLACVAGVTSPATAGGAGGGFVVDTQFWADPSQIVTASGPYAGCTDVVDLGSGAGETGVNQVSFSGEKLVKCGVDWAVIHYDATLTWRSGRKTHGTWFTLDASSAELSGLHGRVDGDSRGCTIQAGSEGCILDRFTVTGR